MCKYCENLSTGWLCEDFIHEDIEMNRVPMFSVCAYIDGGYEEKKGDFYIAAYMDRQPDGDELFRTHIPIKYCPFCGRDLTEES